MIQNERERIGQCITDIRKEKGMTQVQLSERCGLSQVHISRIEAGKYDIRLDTLAAIAKALGRRIALEEV